MAAPLGAVSERWCIVLVVVERDGSLVLVVELTRVTVPCARCAELSRRQHSRYDRHPLDRPWRGKTVRMRVHSRAGSAMRRPACATTSPNASMVNWLATLVGRTAPLSFCRRHIKYVVVSEPAEQSGPTPT